MKTGVVFTQTAQGVSSVSVSPSTATVTKGQKLKLSASVSTTGFANKAVNWTSSNANVPVNQEGVVSVPATLDITGSGTAGVYTISITTALAATDTITVDGVTYTVSADDDTAAKQGAALRSALNVTAITDNYAISGSGANAILTEKSGKYGQVGEPAFEVDSENGVATITETTEGKLPGNIVLVQATSLYDNTKSAIATLTIS